MAIEAALSYSESAVELLKRKKLRRDDLFQYLASQNVVISPKADKHDLIQRVLEHWGSSKSIPVEVQKVCKCFCYCCRTCTRAKSIRPGRVLDIHG